MNYKGDEKMKMVKRQRYDNRIISLFFYLLKTEKAKYHKTVIIFFVNCEEFERSVRYNVSRR